MGDDCYSYGGSSYEIRFHNNLFRNEFNELDKRISEGFCVRGRRSAESLNWRYRENPMGRFEIISLHFQGKLLDYAIFSMETGKYRDEK